MITLFVIAMMLIMAFIYLIGSVFMEYGLLLFVIADIVIAVKFICWLFKPKKKSE